MDDTSIRRQLRFTVRELFLLVIIVALAVAWWLDHTRLVQQQDARRYITRLIMGDAKVGMTMDEVRSAFGPPHDEGAFQSKPYWIYYFDDKSIPMLRIDWDATDRVERISNLH